MRKVTARWLTSKGACSSKEEKIKAEKIGDIFLIIEELKKANRLNDINWLLSIYFNKKQRVQYAVFAAKQVIHLYEEKYPGDDRPRKAIGAAERYVNKQSKKNAYTAANAAAAANAYTAAANAAYANAYTAAYAAAYAAAANAYTAAANAAYAAAYTAAANAYTAAARKETKLKIIDYGLELLRS